MGGVLLLLVIMAAVSAGSPLLGVPPFTFEGTGPAPSAESDAKEFAHLVVTTEPPAAQRSDDVVPLDSPMEQSRFLVTLLMLESLREKPVALLEPKLKAELLADEDLMQEVLKLYETQQETKGKHYIKIPPKLLQKMKKKMKDLLNE